MKEIKVLSFAKINLSIDVTGVLPDGMHQVDMIMHQLSFHDDVKVQFEKTIEKNRFDIEVSTNRYYIPTDERNLAFRAAQLMIEKYGNRVPGGRIRIEIFKRIPVAAGLAGGSGNGAAVLHGLNVLWGLQLSLAELCRLGEKLGSDVPFCIMGQAAFNFNLPGRLRKDPLAGPCCRATGTGTTLETLPGIRKPVVIAKPMLGVSTRAVYAGIDSCEIGARPDNVILSRGLREKDYSLIYRNSINVLENYTLKAYPKVQQLKERMQRCKSCEKVLMSGSGPTVFALLYSISDAKELCSRLRKEGYEAYWTRTVK